MADKSIEIPKYLEDTYWWAYVRPWAVRFFERQWLANIILFGNYIKLRDAALEALGFDVPGRTLQITCCYGNLTPILSGRVAQSGGTLDVIDVVPAQLENLRRKLAPRAPVTLQQMDSAELHFPDVVFDRVLIFFLMHEQPQEHRERTFREALRVLRPGGTIVLVDYGVPSRWNPLRYFVLPILGRLEPFAIELWNRELSDILPDEMKDRSWSKESYFGGLYQRLVSTK